MPKLENLGKVIETDVLVIGAGVSGLWAANRAKEFVRRVTLVDKGPQGWGGLASMAAGGFVAVAPGEPVDKWVEELVYLWDGLCEQDVVEEIFKQSWDRMKDYQRLGVEFITEEDGKLRRVLQRGLDYIGINIGKPVGEGGKKMVAGLINEARRLGVEVDNNQPEGRRVKSTY